MLFLCITSLERSPILSASRQPTTLKVGLIIMMVFRAWLIILELTLTRTLQALTDATAQKILELLKDAIGQPGDGASS